MFAVNARLLSARNGCDVVRFDNNKTLPGCITKINEVSLEYSIDLGGRGGIGVAGQQPSSVRTIMSGRYTLAFVFFAACASDNIRTNIILKHQIAAHA